jgi:hypothetical protein
MTPHRRSKHIPDFDSDSERSNTAAPRRCSGNDTLALVNGSLYVLGKSRTRAFVLFTYSRRTEFEFSTFFIVIVLSTSTNQLRSVFHPRRTRTLTAAERASKTRKAERRSEGDLERATRCSRRRNVHVHAKRHCAHGRGRDEFDEISFERTTKTEQN